MKKTITVMSVSSEHFEQLMTFPAWSGYFICTERTFKSLHAIYQCLFLQYCDGYFFQLRNHLSRKI